MRIHSAAARAAGGLLTAGIQCTLLLNAQPSFAAGGCAKAPTSSVIVDVRQTGAKGDGRTDDTAALQAALDKIAGTGGTVLVPDGTYMVDAVGDRQLKLKNNT